MAGQGDDFGVECQRWLPVSWKPGREPLSPEELARLNEANERVLSWLHGAVTNRGNASDPVIFRLDIIEHMISRIWAEMARAPAPRSATLGAERVCWLEPLAGADPAEGDKGVISLQLEDYPPEPVRFYATLEKVERSGPRRRLCFRLHGLSQEVRDLYEQMVFQYYRRWRAQVPRD